LRSRVVCFVKNQPHAEFSSLQGDVIMKERSSINRFSARSCLFLRMRIKIYYSKLIWKNMDLSDDQCNPIPPLAESQPACRVPSRFGERIDPLCFNKIFASCSLCFLLSPFSFYPPHLSIQSCSLSSFFRLSDDQSIRLFSYPTTKLSNYPLSIRRSVYPTLFLPNY
jgi:hypothetical protein